MKEFLDVFKKTLDFKSRSRRKEYWMFILFTSIISIVLSIIEIALSLEIAPNLGLLSTIFTLIILIPSLSVTVRRLHDIGRTGWWLLLSFIPILGWIALFVFTLLDSESGSNKYGSNPKEFEHDFKPVNN
ncbi:Integral membrane protein [Planococcus halocryophilus Or1]|uniref:DUF805 domain-containing protein n=1 Tax=Planococcus halocryophilus TaxID=1215089 RepID=A0A1C7DR61_9BACL|nr:DUF805 domain-containing protein [Planococcus halocryophilus]ANU13872.1 hypothetical protein BBI08_08425 [Planococcus halocryophilus]EMF47542.1 Integral membrane protein [Planococcus halocryophilus Or1]